MMYVAMVKKMNEHKGHVNIFVDGEAKNMNEFAQLVRYNGYKVNILNIRKKEIFDFIIKTNHFNTVFDYIKNKKDVDLYEKVGIYAFLKIKKKEAIEKYDKETEKYNKEVEEHKKRFDGFFDNLNFDEDVINFIEKLKKLEFVKKFNANIEGVKYNKKLSKLGEQKLNNIKIGITEHRFMPKSELIDTLAHELAHIKFNGHKKDHKNLTSEYIENILFELRGNK